MTAYPLTNGATPVPVPLALPKSTSLFVAELLVVVLAINIAICVPVLAGALACASTRGPLAILAVSNITQVSNMINTWWLHLAPAFG